MGEMSGWFKGLVGLLVVAALALALAWLFGGAGQSPRVGTEAPSLEKEAVPTDTPRPEEKAAPGATVEEEKPVRILYAVQPPRGDVTLDAGFDSWRQTVSPVGVDYLSDLN